MEKWYEIKKGADFQAIAGRGVTARVTFRGLPHTVAVGNTDLIDDLDVDMPDITSDTSEIASETIHDTNLDAIIADMELLSQQGKTPILAAIDGHLAGIVAVAAKPSNCSANVASKPSCSRETIRPPHAPSQARSVSTNVM